MKKPTKPTPRQRELTNRRAAAKRKVKPASKRAPKPAKNIPQNIPAKVQAKPIATPLLRYDAACKALAAAKTFDEVKAIKSEWEHVKLYGKQVRDRTLIAEATEVQTRAERRLGELLTEAKARGWIREGRPKKSDPKTLTDHRVFSLQEVGIDHNTSSRVQKLARLPQREFEESLLDVRERIVSGGATLINGARAIMGSRHEPDDSLDYFPTPPWATRALLEVVLPQVADFALTKQFVWEPACGAGHIADVLCEQFRLVLATDIHDYGYGSDVLDFLGPKATVDFTGERYVDWIITNPPFGDKTEAFVLRALDLAQIGVAMFVRLQWLESVGRYEAVFRDHPPTLLAFFAERVNLCKGRWDPDGTTATAYIWLVWVKGREPLAPFWIPPGQRQALTRPDDAERFTAHPVIRREAFDKQKQKAAA